MSFPDASALETSLWLALTTMVILFDTRHITGPGLSPPGKALADKLRKKFSHLMYKYLAGRFEDPSEAAVKFAEGMTMDRLAREAARLKVKVMSADST